MIKIKKLISFIFALVLVFSFCISSFAAVTADQQANSLYTGWGTGTTVTYASGYGTSWFYRVIYWLSQIKSEVTTTKTSVGNIYTLLTNNLSYIKTAVQNLDTYDNTLGGFLSNIDLYTHNLYDLFTNSQYHYYDLVSAVKDIANNTSGGSSSDLSKIESSLGSKTTSNNSIIYSLNSLAANVSRTVGEFYYYDRLTGEFNASADYFYSTGTDLFNLNTLALASDNRDEQSFINFFSDISYSLLKSRPVGFNPIRTSDNFVNSVAGNLFTLTYTFCAPGSASYYDYLTDSSISYSGNYARGFLSQLAIQTELTSRLAYIFANDDDIAIKKDSEDNSQAVNDNFLSSSGANSVKTDDIGNLSSVSTSVKDTFSTGTSPTGVFDVVNSDNPWEWFTDDVANSLLADGSSSASTFSLRSSPADNDTVVTSYYQDNISDLFSWLKKVG